MGQGVNHIDSYALLSNLISIIENPNLQIHLDNSLPLIDGDCESLEEIFKEFLMNAINEFKENEGTLHITYRDDLHSSFLAFFIQDSSLPEEEKSVSNLVDTVNDFNFAICRKLIIKKKTV
ncbi:hypothetical protein J2X69_001869 [Algoriphagus sp. 4150]|uniref:hypothetical protein n=1 Tax=Algoriphagus sp. 4150 TaxID=2817756 RepID=UPI002860069A|nr:hypothetical protein [Algoriphagus sp. 4150]MDR7129524.1 hypothetical protein [Algoriphagus sp. 4150]